MSEVVMGQMEILSKIRAIVCFGFATSTTGMNPGHYFQVTIDPSACSPSGKYIFFGLHRGDEIHGWQRVDALTIVEDLGPSDAPLLTTEGYSADVNAKVSMRIVA